MFLKQSPATGLSSKFQIITRSQADLGLNKDSATGYPYATQ